VLSGNRDAPPLVPTFVHGIAVGMRGVPLPLGDATKRANEAPRPASYADADDARLVAGCRAGDRAAMRALYDRYQRRVFSLTARIAGAQEAEELTQEVFLKALRGLDKFRGEAQLGTWLYRMAVNAALSHVGRSKDKKRAPEEALEHVAAPPTMVDGDPRMRAHLETALQELPAGYRAVIVLHDVEGLQHEEIAEVLGCRVGTSKSQLHKARAKMRELLSHMLGDGFAAERAR
jgi:RNA polymerase sigma-70 factor (ECF subfamily)